MLVDRVQGCQEGPQVMAHVCHHERAVLDAKVGMGKVGKHSNYLILKPEGSNQRTH